MNKNWVYYSKVAERISQNHMGIQQRSFELNVDF